MVCAADSWYHNGLVVALGSTRATRCSNNSSVLLQSSCTHRIWHQKVMSCCFVTQVNAWCLAGGAQRISVEFVLHAADNTHAPTSVVWSLNQHFRINLDPSVSINAAVALLSSN